jgi:hypothetical protein
MKRIDVEDVVYVGDTSVIILPDGQSFSAKGRIPTHNSIDMGGILSDYVKFRGHGERLRDIAASMLLIVESRSAGKGPAPATSPEAGLGPQDAQDGPQSGPENVLQVRPVERLADEVKTQPEATQAPAIESPEKPSADRQLDELESRLALKSPSSLPFKVNDPTSTGGALARQDIVALCALFRQRPHMQSAVVNKLAGLMFAQILYNKDIIPDDVRFAIIEKKKSTDPDNPILPPEWDAFLDPRPLEETFFRPSYSPDLERGAGESIPEDVRQHLEAARATPRIAEPTDPAALEARAAKLLGEPK